MRNINEIIPAIEKEFSLERIKEIGNNALAEALKVHDELGEKGLEIVQKNQFGETALKADIEAEKAVIEYLKTIGFPIRMHSEEHGIFDISDNPSFLGVLDGIDGTSNYKKARGEAKYATMLGIYSSINPRYCDYIFNGLMQHSTKKLFYALKGQGSYVNVNGNDHALRCSDTKTLNKNTNIYIDPSFEINKDFFTRKMFGFKMKDDTGSTSILYSDLVSGEVDLCLECTFKGNLEKGAGYGLIHEAGGVMRTMENEDLGEKKYLDYGQDEHLPIISACTPELADDLMKFLLSK